jgi:hypothetical protein
MVLLHPINVRSDHGQKSFLGRNLWTGFAQLAGAHGSRPQNGRFGDAMGDILGYARVSTGDQDIAGQTVRLVAAGAIRIFSDVRSGRSIMDRPGLDALLAGQSGEKPLIVCGFCKPATFLD